MKLTTSALFIIFGITSANPKWKTVISISHEEYHSDNKHMWIFTDWILDSDSSYIYEDKGIQYEMLFNKSRGSVFVWNNYDDSYEIRIKLES